MGYPTSPVRLKDPGPKQTKREPIPVMELAKRLAGDVRSGRKTGDKAVRELIARLSYYRTDTDRVPTYTAKLIAAASDLIYSAELNSPSYHDPAEDEALRMLQAAVLEARGSS